jgi:hypothetical protein
MQNDYILLFLYRELEFQIYIDNHMSKIHNELVDHKNYLWHNQEYAYTLNPTH